MVQKRQSKDTEALPSVWRQVESMLTQTIPTSTHLTSLVFPEHSWDRFKFKNKPKKFWKYLENQQEYMQQLEKEFEVHHPKDWLEVNVAEFRKGGGLPLFRQYPTFVELLRAVYPEEPWDTYRQRTPRVGAPRGRRAGFRSLRRAARSIDPRSGTARTRRRGSARRVTGPS